MDDGVDAFQGIVDRAEIGDVTVDDLSPEPLPFQLVAFRPGIRAPIDGTHFVASGQIV